MLVIYPRLTQCYSSCFFDSFRFLSIWDFRTVITQCYCNVPFLDLCHSFTVGNDRSTINLLLGKPGSNRIGNFCLSRRTELNNSDWGKQFGDAKPVLGNWGWLKQLRNKGTVTPGAITGEGAPNGMNMYFQKSDWTTADGKHNRGCDTKADLTKVDGQKMIGSNTKPVVGTKKWWAKTKKKVAL